MATPISRKLFVNLAVRDLPRSVEFFTELGFTFNPNFTDGTATCMIVSEEAFVMLLVANRFADFTKKQICDNSTHTEALLDLVRCRAEVDALSRRRSPRAASAMDPQDHGFMYAASRSGRPHWESLMDPDANPNATNDALVGGPSRARSAPWRPPTSRSDTRAGRGRARGTRCGRTG